MPSRNITLLVRAVGARSAARDMTLVSRATAGVGASSRRASRDVGLLATSFGLAKSAAKGAALGLGVVGAQALKTGIQYNAMMEQQKIAFTSFLGSGEAAEGMLRRLYDLAAVTPFEFPDLVKGTRTMLAYGMAASTAEKTMSLLGDAIAAAPTEDTANQIARTTRALGQIQAAGILHAQDLNQLVDAGVTSVPKLAKSMGLSTKEFRKQMMLGQVDAERFFKAQNELWEKDPIYSGMAEKQAKTFYGRLATLHDYWIQLMGSMTESQFGALTDKVLPGFIDFTKKANEIWKNQDAPWEEKAKDTKKIAEETFGPMLDDFEAWWKREDVTRRIQDAMAYAFEQAARGAFGGLKIYLKTLFNMVWEGNWAAKLTAGVLLAKLGMRSRLLRAASKLMWGKLFGKGGKGAGSVDAVMNVKAGVVNVYGPGAGGLPDGPGGGKPGSKPKKPGKWGRLGRIARRAAGPFAGFGAATGLTAAAPFLGGAALSAAVPLGLAGAAAYSRAHNPFTKLSDAEKDKVLYDNARALGFEPDVLPMGSWTAGNMQATLGHLASGGFTSRAGYYEVGEHGKERVFLPQGANVKPDNDRPIHVTSNLVVDGRVLATAVHRASTKAAASR